MERQSPLQQKAEPIGFHTIPPPWTAQEVKLKVRERRAVNYVQLQDRTVKRLALDWETVVDIYVRKLDI